MAIALKYSQRLRAARQLVTKYRTDYHSPKLWNAATRKLADGKRSVWLSDEFPFAELPPDVVIALKRCDHEAEEAGLVAWD